MLVQMQMQTVRWMQTVIRVECILLLKKIHVV
jgi:hypothetical protein